MWTLENLKSELENLTGHGKVNQWKIRETEKTRKEFYLIQERQGSDAEVGLDQDRLVEQALMDVMVSVPASSKEKHGMARGSLFPKKALKPQLEKLLETAAISEEKAWGFPEPSKKAKVKPELCYRGLKDKFELTSEGILEDMNKAIASVDTGLFNSSEIFVSKEQVRTLTSTGFENEGDVSRIFSEVCFSFDRNENESEEFLITEWNCHPEQFNYLKMCQDSAEFAEKSLGTVRPPSGEFPVLIHSDVIAEIMHDALSHLDRRAQYYKMPFIEQGHEFVTGFDGEAFELSLAPGEDYMLGSSAFDGLGLAQQDFSLVKNNRVTGNISSSQYAQYMGESVTPHLGNLKLEARGLPFEKLTQAAPKVIEILQFSGLFTSPLDLTFSSEIRLARLYDNETGKVHYIKGGSLSGNLMTNLREVLWSKETKTQHAADWGGTCKGYIGPAYALLSDVSISS